MARPAKDSNGGSHETRKMNGMRRRSALKAPDRFLIGNKAEDRSYRMVSRKLLEKNGGFDPRGWIPITAENSKGETLVTRTQTIIISGNTPVEDLVVAFMPKEIVEDRRAELDAINNSKLRDNVSALRAQGKNAGVPISDDTEVQRQGISETY